MQRAGFSLIRLHHLIKRLKYLANHTSLFLGAPPSHAFRIFAYGLGAPAFLRGFEAHRAFPSRPRREAYSLQSLAVMRRHAAAFSTAEGGVTAAGSKNFPYSPHSESQLRTPQHVLICLGVNFLPLTKSTAAGKSRRRGDAQRPSP